MLLSYRSRIIERYSVPSIVWGDICYPFFVWTVSLELAVQQIPILMHLLSHILPLPFSADFRQDAMLFHDPKYSFGVVVDPLAFQPEVHPPVPAGLETAPLLQAKLLSQSKIFLGLSQALYIIIVTASGNAKEPAHGRYRILCPMTIDHLIFELRLHILSVSERKSCSN